MIENNHIQPVLKMNNMELAHFSRDIHDQTYLEYYTSTEGMSLDEGDDFIKEMVREMMRRNLVIPRGGSGRDLMAIAESLAGEEEFGNKYSEMGLE